MTTGPTQEERGRRFAALHEGPCFLIPNPWDGGSARVLEALGFAALATSSSAFAFTLGRGDGGVTLDELAEHVATLAAATDLPISVDLENGFGATPEHAARAVEAAAAVGAVGRPLAWATAAATAAVATRMREDGDLSGLRGGAQVAK